MSKPVNLGILAAILSIALLFGLYFIEKQLIVIPFVKSLRYFVFIICAWMAVGAAKDQIEDKSVLASWIQPAFVTFIVASTIFTIFNFILYRYIDTELYELNAAYLRENFPEIQEKGVPGQTREIVNVSLEEAVSISRTVFSLAGEIIVGFIFSAIIALIWRNK